MSMTTEEEYTRKSVTITHDDAEFLDEYDSINLSGLARDALKEEKAKKGWNQ